MSRLLTMAVALVLSIGGSARAQDATGQGQVTSFSSSDIVEATTTAAGDLACLDFRVNGVCLFLVCTPVGCEVETSIQYRHFNPALIVTSYNALGESPWEEIQGSFGSPQVSANQVQSAALGVDAQSLPGGGGLVDETAASGESDDERPGRARQVVFKNAEVVGSPGNALSLAGSLGLPLFCPTTDVFPLFPYFLSGIDAFAWGSGVTEIAFPETFIPGLREIGDFPFNSWGSVHPRHGFLSSPEEPKAAAVMAQRAADIATRTLQPHVYIPVGSVPGLPSGSLKVFEPDEVVEGNPDNSKWQFLAPVTEASCEAFGENDTANVADGWSNNRVSDSGDYAWALWRPYRCCEQRGAFLTEIEFFQ